MANGERDPSFFFIHVMKTAGTTLWGRAGITFGRDAMYPDQRTDPISKVVDYYGVGGFLRLDEARRARTRFYAGHVPFALAHLTDPEALRITLLREPVARTLSYLRQCQRSYEVHRDKSLEEIYEDPWFYPRFIDNHQTKLFSMTADEVVRGPSDPIFDHGAPGAREMAASELADSPELAEALRQLIETEGQGATTLLRFADRAPTELVEVDDARLQAALDNLEQVELLGTNDHVEDLLALLADRWGWAAEGPPRLNVGDAAPASASFRRRIARDNAADTVLYQRALEIGVGGS
jgi:hypothetical protein